jgi:hypothetical protein
VDEGHSRVDHFRGNVAITKPPLAGRSSPPGLDPHPDLLDERLQRDRRLDRASQGSRGPAGDGDAEVLVEDPSQLDAGLEEERLPWR